MNLRFFLSFQTLSTKKSENNNFFASRWLFAFITIFYGFLFASKHFFCSVFVCNELGVMFGLVELFFVWRWHRHGSLIKKNAERKSLFAKRQILFFWGDGYCIAMESVHRGDGLIWIWLRWVLDTEFLLIRFSQKFPFCHLFSQILSKFSQFLSFLSNSLWIFSNHLWILPILNFNSNTETFPPKKRLLNSSARQLTAIAQPRVINFNFKFN